jgi:hypothetical protein
MGGAKNSPRIDHQTLCKQVYRDYRSRIMPATSAAAAAKKRLSSATWDTTETIRACMHDLRRRTTWARPAVPQPPVRNPWTRRVLCIDLQHTSGFGKSTKQLKSLQKGCAAVGYGPYYGPRYYSDVVIGPSTDWPKRYRTSRGRSAEPRAWLMLLVSKIAWATWGREFVNFPRLAVCFLRPHG